MNEKIPAPHEIAGTDGNHSGKNYLDVGRKREKRLDEEEEGLLVSGGGNFRTFADYTEIEKQEKKKDGGEQYYCQWLYVTVYSLAPVPN